MSQSRETRKRGDHMPHPHIYAHPARPGLRPEGEAPPQGLSLPSSI